MKKIVSFFGERSEKMCQLNNEAKAYALSLNLEYEWKPQSGFIAENIIKELNKTDIAIIDIKPYDDMILSKIRSNGAKLLIRFGVGYDNVNLSSATKRGIAVARTTGANTFAVAEMAFSLMMAAKKNLHKNDLSVRTLHWEKNISSELIGGTVGLLGFGNIGKEFRELLRGFNVKVLVCDNHLTPENAEKFDVEIVELETLFEKSDAISIHIPYRKENHHIVNERLISLMKPYAVLINTARGGLIDEVALYHALKNKTIFGAGLDVFETEPLSSDSPLISLENIILTPHTSSQTIESLWKTYKMAIDIADDFINEKSCFHILNPDYKKYI